MSGNLKLPFITNTIPSFKAAKSYPEMKLFLEAMVNFGISPDFVYFNRSSRANISTIGIRSDKTVDGTVQMIRNAKKMDNAILHLHLGSNEEPSYASILIDYFSNQGFSVYISGLNQLEIKKTIAKIDFTLNSIPKELDDKDCEIILKNFQKVHYVEMFEQTLNSLPIINDKLKSEIIKDARTRLLTKEKVLKVRRLVNISLILECWNKYHKLINNLFSDLWQKSDIELSQSAKVMLNLLIPDFSSLIKKMYKSALPAQKEIISKIKKKNDFINYISILPNTGIEEDYIELSKDLICKEIFVERLKKDSTIFRKIKLINSENSEMLRIKSSLMLFIEDFKSLKKTINIVNKKEQISDELKKLYINKLVKMMLTTVDSASIPVKYDRAVYKKQILKVLDLDVFAVDRLIINPVIKTNSSLHYVVNRIFPQIQMSFEMSEKMIYQLLIFINKNCVDFISIKNKLQKVAISHRSEVAKKEYNEFINKNVSFIPKIDFLLYTNEVRSIEKQLFLDAKKSLGMDVFDSDFQISGEDLKTGYTQIEVTPIHKIKKFTFNPRWLYEIYFNFIKFTVKKHLAETQSANIDYLRANKVNGFDFLWQKLKTDGIFIGYHQLADIIINFKGWDIGTISGFGYINQSNVLIDNFNLLLDPDNWGFDSEALNIKPINQNKKDIFSNSNNNYKAVKSKKNWYNLQPIKHINIISDKSLHKFLKYNMSNWQNKIDEILESDSDEYNMQFWISEFLKSLNASQVFNIYSDKASTFFPPNNNISEIKIFIQEFFKNNFENIKNPPNYFIVQHDIESAFIAYFARNLSVEINNTLIPIIFNLVQVNHIPEDSINWKWNSCLKQLILENKALFINLRHAWRELHKYNKYYFNLVNAVSLLITYDLVNKYLKPQDLNQFSVIDFKKIDDQFKLAIYNVRPEDCNEVLIRAIHGENMYSLNEFQKMLYNYNRSELDKKILNFILNQINQFLSIIPYIRYAPKIYKSFRFNIKKIEKMLGNKISEMEEYVVDNIKEIAAETWEIYSKIVDRELSYAFRYRYLLIAFNNLHTRVDRRYEHEFIDFIRSSADELSGKKSARFYMLARMKEAIIFKNYMTKKSIFYIFPEQSKLSELSYALEGIRSMKGIDSDIFIDQRGTQGFREELFTYTRPENIVDLKKKTDS